MGFRDEVYKAAKQIPRGRVSTYKEIARALGSRGYRAVGQALHVNPFASSVPCHRVVSSDGSLGGFASGVRRKLLLLKKEGVVVTGGSIDLERYFVRLKKRKGHKAPFMKRR